MHSYRIAVSVVVLDTTGKMLLVREADPRAYGKINLPGGHLEDNELVVECAERELREETSLATPLSFLLGLYLHGDIANFVFVGHSTTNITQPGPDILSCEWMPPSDVLSIPEQDTIRPEKLHAIVNDLISQKRFPMDVVRNIAIGIRC